MKQLMRRALRHILQFLTRYPSVKRVVVDLVYRIPAIDSAMRTVAHRIAHPEAVLDVDASRMPDASRRAFDRMRGRTSP